VEEVSRPGALMKFILVFTICTQMYQNCLPPTPSQEIYNSHFECATSGYKIAEEMMKQMGQDRVNNDRIVIGFKCQPRLDI